MPESTTDRPTQAVEYVFLLTKSGTAQYWTHTRKWGTTRQPKPDYIWRHKKSNLTVEYQPVSDRILKEFWKRSNLWQGHDYFYDGENVRVKYTKPMDRWGGDSTKPTDKSKGSDFAIKERVGREHRPDPSGRSRRNSDWFMESWQGLWTDENGEPIALIVNPKPYKRAHFATFPPGLVIPCLKAGTSEKGCCPECGSPWVRVIKSQKSFESGSGKSGNPISGKYPDGCQGGGDTGDVRKGPVLQTQTLGWRPTCSCSKDSVPCLAFDPFAGTGTVIEVARKMGRSGLGFEISEEYVKKYCGERLAQGVFDLRTREKRRKAEGK